MSTFKVIDKGGEWVVNPHAFAFVDPETGNRFSPAEVMKVKVEDGSWLAGQMDAKVIVFVDDPTEPPPTKKSVTAPKADPAGV